MLNEELNNIFNKILNKIGNNYFVWIVKLKYIERIYIKENVHVKNAVNIFFVEKNFIYW